MLRSNALKPVLALAASVAALAAPVVAAAGFEVRGGGFGHGVGLSQYGAYGYAQHGWSHSEILAHYYSGTDLGTVTGARVRILLQASRPGSASVTGATSAADVALDPSRTYTIEPASATELRVRAPNGTAIGTFGSPLDVHGANDQMVLGGQALNGVSNGRYRGAMEFRNGASGGVTAINDVGVDEYLRSVVPGEMPPSWHPEALRAQAVAARSYALATKRGGDVFDHYPDTRSQTYRGTIAEHPNTDAAVAATSGEVVLYGGSIAETVFFSTSGGHTEDSENVFGGSIPYLRGVPDQYDDISPHHHWSISMTRSQLTSELDPVLNGRFERLEVVERGASRRILRGVLRGSKGDTTVSGSTLKHYLGTRDIPYRIPHVSGRRGR